MMLPEKEDQGIIWNGYFSIEGEKGNKIVKNIHVHKIRARKEGKLSCGNQMKLQRFLGKRNLLWIDYYESPSINFSKII